MCAPSGQNWAAAGSSIGCTTGAVAAGEEEAAHEERGDLGDGERPPDQVGVAVQAQQPGGGHQHKELAYQRDQQRHDAAAQGLEHRRRDDVEARDDEVDGDDAQSHLAQGEHVGTGVEDAEHDAGAELCGREAQQHDGHGGNHRHPDDLYNAPGFAGAVVVGDDGDHAVVEADEGHDDEALHLEVDAEHSHRGAGESDEDAVHAEVMTLPTEVMAMEGMPTW